MALLFRPPTLYICIPGTYISLGKKFSSTSSRSRDSMGRSFALEKLGPDSPPRLCDMRSWLEKENDIKVSRRAFFSNVYDRASPTSPSAWIVHILIWKNRDRCKASFYVRRALYILVFLRIRIRNAAILYLRVCIVVYWINKTCKVKIWRRTRVLKYVWVHFSWYSGYATTGPFRINNQSNEWFNKNIHYIS